MRVLLLDGNDFYRTGLRILLADRGFEVAEAKTAEEARRRVRQFAPRALLMDVQVAGVSSTALTAQVIKQAPDTAVIMLSTAVDAECIVDSVLAGASGYLLKDADVDEIVAAIRAAAAGSSWMTPAAASALIAHVRAWTSPAESAPLPLLSEREREVLALLTLGCDNAEIGQRLYLSSSTVKVHVSRLLVKLGVENRVQAAVYAARHGAAEAPILHSVA